MKPPPFDYACPESLEEAVALFAEFGPDATPLAGGMSLGAMLNMRLVRPGIVVDLNKIPGLDEIAHDGATLRTGAMVRQSVAMHVATIAENVPMLGRALPHVGHFQTRNRGTLGGSVSHADPSAEIPLCLLAAGGSVSLVSKRGTRDVPAEEFILGMLTTARGPDEILVALSWPAAGAECGDGFCEIAQRHGDFAITAAAARAEVDGSGQLTALRFALGGVEDRPRLIDTTDFLGASADPSTARAITDGAAGQVEPIEDLQANADYRRHLVSVLGVRALTDAFAKARQGGADA